MEKANLKNTLLSLNMLVRRNIKIFLKDGMMVLFSVLAPVIVLLIYILFLGNLQVASINDYVLEEGIDISTNTISAIINNWMIAGVMAVSCLTVSVNANMSMVRDRSSGTVNDILVSPVKRWVIYASYVISCFLITFCICLVILFVSFIYLACTGGFMLNFSDIMALIGITILSCISSSLFIVLLCGFIRSVGTMSAFNGIYGTVIGFVIGAYLPFNQMPAVMKYIACFVPGAYSAGLYKNYFMRGIIDSVSQVEGGSEFVSKIMNEYSIELDFFGTKISPGWMVLALVLSILLFGALIIIFYSSKKTNIFTAEVKKIKNKKAKSVEKEEVKMEVTEEKQKPVQKKNE